MRFEALLTGWWAGDHGTKPQWSECSAARSTTEVTIDTECSAPVVLVKIDEAAVTGMKGVVAAFSVIETLEQKMRCCRGRDQLAGPRTMDQLEHLMHGFQSSSSFFIASLPTEMCCSS